LCITWSCDENEKKGILILIVNYKKYFYSSNSNGLLPKSGNESGESGVIIVLGCCNSFCPGHSRCLGLILQSTGPPLGPNCHEVLPKPLLPLSVTDNS